MSKIAEKLIRIQTELKAPKNLYNNFGKYKYRNAEGICEAVKPFLKENGCVLLLTDEIVAVGERIYVKATARIIDSETEESYRVSAFAREPETKKGMDDSQITGTASSYARKYALNGLFLLDDTKDADTEEYHSETIGRTDGTAKKAKVNMIQKRIAADKVNSETFCKMYKVSKVEEMTETQLDNALANWDKVKERC